MMHFSAAYFVIAIMLLCLTSIRVVLSVRNFKIQELLSIFDLTVSILLLAPLASSAAFSWNGQSGLFTPFFYCTLSDLRSKSMIQNSKFRWK